MIKQFIKDNHDALFKALISTVMLFLAAYLIADVALVKYKKGLAEKQGEINILKKQVGELQKSNEAFKDNLYRSITSDSMHFYQLEKLQRTNIKNTHNGGIKTANRVIYLSNDSLSELFSKYNGK